MGCFIMRLQYIQFQSRQEILPGPELFYGHLLFRKSFLLFMINP